MDKQLRTQKDNLARLMATEDLTIVHKKVPTAYFDVKNRILCCPTFKDDISPQLYDLFMGHEVGHALHTPYEGLHSTLKENRTLKGYLNVVEDVRIEKAIKNKYEGLRRSFYTAYDDLMNRDFFGLKKMSIPLSGLSLIDKINLQTKVGSRVNLDWTDEEHDFLNWARNCKTWEEVVECSQAIYEWSKENETRTDKDKALTPVTYVPGEGEEDFEEGEDGQTLEEMFEDENTDSFGGDVSDGIWDEENEDKLPDPKDVKADNPIEDDELGGKGDGSKVDGDGDEESEKTDTGLGGHEGGEFSGNYDDEDGARESITEHNAHNNEEQFLEEKPTIRTQIDLRKTFKENGGLVIEDVFVSYKDVIKDWREFFGSTDGYHNKKEIADGLARAKCSAKKITNKNKKLIMHMAKEFEMRQTAMRSAKAFQGKTGQLDMNRIAKYQIVDDIFKRVTYIPDGKNHGVTVLLDWSGSIYRQVPDLLEQTIILAEFCRTVQIPYNVYLFSDAYRKRDKFGKTRGKDGGYLVQVLSNEMKNKEHIEVMWYLASLWNNHVWTSNWNQRNKKIEAYNKWFSGVHEIIMDGYGRIETSMRPSVYTLGGTPLDNGLVALRKRLPEFNKKYGIEKSILTIITDGYSHSSPLLDLDDEEMEDKKTQKEFLEEEDSWEIRQSREILDPYSNKVFPYSSPARYYGSNSFNQTQNLLDWLSKTCHVIVTGYFCLERKNDLYNLMNDIRHGDPDYGWYDFEKVWKEARKHGSVIKCHGYNKLFATTPKALGVAGEDALDDEFIDAKKVRVMAAFKRNQKSKTTSRFLTNEFIKEIS